MVQRLIEGLHKFQQQELGRYRSLFNRLAVRGQDPHTLFITCSDSRVIAELVTQSQPGDLFVVKNVGNIIPSADSLTEGNSVGAAIEFAVGVLKVQDIVVCGHSQCGAMAALLGEAALPPCNSCLCRWLKQAEPVRKVVEENYGHLKKRDERLNAAAEENILFGLENLLRYPVVEEAMSKGELGVHGWFFKIATAQMFAYNRDLQQFEPLLA